jgi:hypothetical protein
MPSIHLNIQRHLLIIFKAIILSPQLNCALPLSVCMLTHTEKYIQGNTCHVYLLIFCLGFLNLCAKKTGFQLFFFYVIFVWILNHRENLTFETQNHFS